MKMLYRKSLRSLKSIIGQCVALAVVVASGGTAYYGTTATLHGLISSRDRVYQESRFADHYFDVVSAPQSIANTLRTLPGVLDVTPRINQKVKIVRNGVARDAGRLVSCEEQSGVGINMVKILEGRRFERNGSIEPEVMIDRQYAFAHGIRPGETIDIIAKGVKCRLKIVGIATGPEFLHKKKSSLEFPGWGGLGIILTDLATAQKIIGMPGEVNQFLIRNISGEENKKVSREAADILDNYGVRGNYPREDHQSHRYIKSQIQTLELAASLLPPWIFMAALIMQAILVRRMVRGERRQIGIFKALGHDFSSIILIYSIPPLIIGLIGSVAGIGCGIGLTHLMSTLLERAIDLPVAGYGFNPQIALKTVMLSMIVPLSSGILASREIAKIDPAAAFREELPPVQKRTLAEKFVSFWKNLPSSWKMSLRSISRNRGRFISLTLGMLICLGMLLVTFRFSDSRDTMLHRHFQIENRYDYAVKFGSLLPVASLEEMKSWPEIKGIESSLEIPVKLFRIDDDGGGASRNELLMGLYPSGTFKNVYDLARRPLEIPNEGIILSRASARVLKLSAGDRIVVETREGMGAPRRITMLVRAVSGQHISGHSIVSINQAAEFLGERSLVNSAMIRSREADFSALEERLVRIPEVSSILSQKEQHINASNLTEAINWFSVVLAFFAMIIGSSIVYKNSMMSYIERKREIATLRVIGWTAQEIAAMLLNEVILAYALGIIIGIPIAVRIGSYYLRAISTETFSWPIVLYPSTCLISIGATGFFALAGHYLAVRRVRNQDLLETLKSRE